MSGRVKTSRIPDPTTPARAGAAVATAVDGPANSKSGRNRPRILGVGCLPNNTETAFERFRSAATFLDYDVVIWDPATTIDEYDRQSGYPTYRGLPSLNDGDSVRLVDDMKRRRQEFAQLLELGRTVVVLVSGPQSCYVDTGRRNTSGTGRNAQTTRIVDDVSIFEALPFPIEVVTAAGTQVELCAGEPFAGLWREVQNLLRYRAYFKAEKATPFFVIEHTDRVVGAVIRRERGLVLLLPAPDWSQSDGDDDMVEDEQELVDAIVALVERLREETGDFRLPDWSGVYELPGERDHRAALEGREQQRDQILAQIDEEKGALLALEQRKLLFTGSGVALEVQVKAAFRALDFEVTEAAPGRDDFIAERAGRAAVVEVKGVNKSGAEKHAAQLEKWVAGYYEQHGRQPKGILVVNAYMDAPLEERTALSFPDQMLPYSTGRGHALVTGLQLMGAWLDVEQYPERADEIAANLLDTVGRWDRYGDWTEFLKRSAVTVPAST